MERRRIHRLARAVSRDRAVSPHRGGLCPGTRTASARRGHRRPSRRDRRLNAHQRIWWEEHDPSESPNPTLVEQLRKIEQEIRQKFVVEKTLREQLDEAVAREDYEQAARLRDQIQAQAQPLNTRVRRRLRPLRYPLFSAQRSMQPSSPSRRVPLARRVLRRKRVAGRSSRRPGGSGATQLKQAPKPQAMWFSSETSQGMRKVATSLAKAASMAGGPQPTTFAGLSPSARRRASKSVTKPW